MTMEHIKGPWRLLIQANSRDMETPTRSFHYGEEYIAVVSADGEVIADNADYYPAPIRRRDASLIAAAPELLSALQMIVQLNPELPMGVIEDAEAAIAKATGEQA